MPLPLALLPFVFVSLLAPPEEMTVRSLFASERRVEVTPSGMTVVYAPQHHVLVARVENDGSLTTGCAASEEAVEALLQPPARPKQAATKDR